MKGKRTIAVMQPYFFPYAGYFRLMSASDVFVVFDDVQFPRRGRVHRCEMAPGRWLTLPLAPMPLDTLIKARYLSGPLGDVIGFLEDGLRQTADALKLKAEILRSSNLGVDPALRGQSRVIALVQALGGQRYVNAPGGRNLYSAESFQEAGIDLRFLVPT